MSPDLSGDLRIFLNFQIILYNHFQAAWVKMRRCLTRRLIVNHAVCKSDQIFFRSMHKGEYLYNISGFFMTQLWSPCKLMVYINLLCYIYPISTTPTYRTLKHF